MVPRPLPLCYTSLILGIVDGEVVDHVRNRDNNGEKEMHQPKHSPCNMVRCDFPDVHAVQDYGNQQRRQADRSFMVKEYDKDTALELALLHHDFLNQLGLLQKSTTSVFGRDLQCELVR